MGKLKEELLKTELSEWDEEIPLLDTIYVIPTRRKHDSGYMCMEVIGEVTNIKTSETTQEKYCIEFNEELEEEAKELIGKEVKISYGTRVGLYSTSKCHQAPVEDIQLIED